MEMLCTMPRRVPGHQQLGMHCLCPMHDICLLRPYAHPPLTPILMLDLCTLLLTAWWAARLVARTSLTRRPPALRCLGAAMATTCLSHGVQKGQPRMQGCSPWRPTGCPSRAWLHLGHPPQGWREGAGDGQTAQFPEGRFRGRQRAAGTRLSLFRTLVRPPS